MGEAVTPGDPLVNKTPVEHAGPQPLPLVEEDPLTLPPRVSSRVRSDLHPQPPPALKRYGVLHPYPLHSLWRSSPGQIRNFPVDATAS